MTTIGTLITAANFNSVLTSVTSILSTYYGSSVTAQSVTTGATPIGRDNWANLQADINRCLIHQSNTGAAYSVPNTGTLITAAYINSLASSAATIWDNKATVGSNQLVSDAVNGVSARTTTWASDIQHQTQHYWPSSNDAAYFFQQGGYIKPTLSRNTGFPTTAANTAWANLIDLVLADPDYINYRYSLSSYDDTLAPYIKTDGTNIISISFTKNNSQLITTDVILNPAVSYLAIDVLPSSTVYNYYSTDSLGGTLSPRPAVQTSIPFNAGGSLVTKTLTYDYVSPVTLNALGSVTTTVTLNNIGNTVCTVTGLAFAAQSGSSLSAAFSTTSFTIPSGGSASFNITISGNTKGSYLSNSITVTSDNDAGSVQIPINATVTAPVFVVAATPASITSTVTTYNPVSTTFTFDPGVTGTILNLSAVLSNNSNFTISVSPPYRAYISFGFSLFGGSGFWYNVPATATLTFTPPRVATGVNTTNITFTFTPEDASQSIATDVVPVSYTTNVVNQHLGHWISPKNANNGVIGFSYDIIEGVKTLTAGFGMGGDGSPQVSNGGAVYASISTLGLSADLQSSLGIPLYSTTESNYCAFLNAYGSWPCINGGTRRPGSFSNTYNFTVPLSGTYYLTLSTDNYGSVLIDGAQPLSWSDYRSYTQRTIYLSAGSHTVTISATNTGGPGAIGVVISATADHAANVYWSTRTPVRVAYQYWGEAYRIPLTLGSATYESKNYIAKKTDIAAGTIYGRWLSGENVFKVSDDGNGNLSITISPWTGTYTGYSDVDITIGNTQYLPYYYSEAETRITNLESPINVSYTRYFLGFNNQGTVLTSVVPFPPAPPPPVYYDFGGGGDTGDSGGNY